MRVAKRVFAWLALTGILSLCLFSFVLSEDSTVEAQASTWEQPVYQDGRWRLEGITEPGVESQDSPWGRLDLVRVRYGRGAFWSVAGLTDEQGSFESWVEGVSSHEQLLEGFRKPRHVTLSIPGSRQGFVSADCSGHIPAACSMLAALERGTLVADLAGASGGQASQSGILIQTGAFPERYLAWEIAPGEVIERELEE